MSYYCYICDKIIKIKSKNKHLNSINHKELEKFFCMIHSIENPKFFNVDDIYNDFINNHKKNIFSFK